MKSKAPPKPCREKPQRRAGDTASAQAKRLGWFVEPEASPPPPHGWQDCICWAAIEPTNCRDKCHGVGGVVYLDD